MSRAGDEWLAICAADDRRRIAELFSLSWPINPEADDVPSWLALIDMGICAATVVREPYHRVSAAKADRDADLDRPTMHLAPRWRYPITGAEDGDPALILPVSEGEKSCEPLSLRRLRDEDFADRVSDLIAIPFDGSRPLSMTGYTRAVGDLRADAKGRMVVYGSGMAWVRLCLAQAQEISADTMPHLVERLHVPFPLPPASLLVEPQALEWRVTQWTCVIPTDAREIVCPDSRRLALTIDAAMRKKERARPLPIVRGPAPQEGCAA